MTRRVRTYSNDQPLVNERRGQIIKRATQVLVKKGLAQTNMRKVADACNMSMGSLYHYVGSKEDILYLIFEHELARTAERLKQCAEQLRDTNSKEALRKYTEAYYRVVDEIQDVVLSIHRDLKNLPRTYREHLLEMEANFVAGFEELIKRGVERGELRAKDPGLIAHNMVILGQVWALRRWYLRKHYTLEKYTQEQLDFIMDRIEVESAAGNPKPQTRRTTEKAQRASQKKKMSG
jgi:AcrR family transcriptional regulator